MPPNSNNARYRERSGKTTAAIKKKQQEKELDLEDKRQLCTLVRQGHLSNRLVNITDLALKSKQRFRKINKFKWNGELFCDGVEV